VLRPSARIVFRRKKQKYLVSPRGTECAPAAAIPPARTVAAPHRGSRPRAPLSATRFPVRHTPSPRRRLLLPPPTNVSRILIVGAGGFGRELLHWARAAWPPPIATVAGFLSADEPRPCRRGDLPPVIGDPADFVPAAGDGFLLGVGIPDVRRRLAETLMARGARFLTLVHPTAIIAPVAEIGAGSIICPFAVVSDDARLGRCVLLNYHASLGHDSSAGDFAVLSPYATLGGNAHVAEDVFLGMHASVGPGRRVGPRSKVSANSCALADAPADSLVFGAPGRIAPLVR
jgi:sugar O-acyltransferase (sialic acid O-acetyltransferase NeuD family)